MIRDYISTVETMNQKKIVMNLFSYSIVIEGQRGCLSRWFGKMEEGSFRASVLSLTATAIGGGIPLTIMI